MKNKILILALFSLLFACDKDNYDWTNKTDKLNKHNEKKISVSEGIWGTLVQREGDGMPGGNYSLKEFPIQREIAVYEYTTIKDIIGYPNYCLPTSCEVSTRLISTTTCDKEGFFEFELKPGKYSVFVKEKGKLYANGLDGVGGINPVEVELSKVSGMTLSIDYAVY